MIRIKKGVIVGTVIAALAVTSSYAILATNKNSDFKTAGTISQDILKKNGKAVIVVDGEVITDKDIELSKISFAGTSEEVIKEDLIADKLLYKAAIKSGVTVTEEELNKSLSETQKMIKSDANSLDQLNNYITGLGMTEEQYWAKAKEEYKKIITNSKFKEVLKDNFIKENKLDVQKDNVDEKFMSYYKKYIKGLKEEAKIEYKK